MRLGFLVGGVLSVGTLLVLAACGSSDASSDTGSGDDGGGSSSGASGRSSSGSSGASSGDFDAGGDGSTPVKPRGTNLSPDPVILLGVTSDGYAVYQTLPATQGGPSSLEALPLSGGAKITIAATLAASDVATVSGAAVAWWTSVANGVGTFNVWTKTNGAKTNAATASATEMFAATKDGTRIAFAVNATPAGAAATSTGLAVSGSASPVTPPVLTGINLAAAQPPAAGGNPSCAPDIDFAGSVLLAAYCTGTSASAAAARLYAVSAGGTATRLDATGSAAAAAQPFWSSDSAGAKVFALTTGGSGRYITGSPPGTTLDANTNDGFMRDDGTGMVYQTATGIVSATAAAPPVKTQLLAAGTAIKGLLAISKDQKRLLFQSLAPSADGLVDIRSIDSTSAAQAPIDIVATAAAFPLGFTGDSKQVLYFTDISATGVTLKTKTAVGTGETTLATGIANAIPAQTGTAVMLRANPQKDAASGITFNDILSIDAAKGGTPSPIAGQVPTGLYEIHGSKLVYVTFDKSAPGLYVTDLP